MACRKVTELKFLVPWGHVAGQAWGSPKNKPVLLVHGTLDNAGAFSRLIQVLPPDYYYVAIDLPGHGLSSHFPEGLLLDFFNFVNSIHFVLEELQWDSCLYIGHSLGAQLGVMYSIFFPGRLEKIVALDALFSRGFKPRELPGRLQYVINETLNSLKQKNPPLYSKEEVLEALMTRRQFTLTRPAAEALFDRGVAKVGDKYMYNRDIRMRSIVALYFTLEQNLEFVKKLSVPVLLIIAENSWYALARETEAVKQIQQQLSDAVSVIFVEGNHDVHNNNPENIAHHIISFFGGDQKSKL